MKLSKVSTFCLTVFLCVFAWEYIGKLVNTTYIPSVFLNMVASYCESVWVTVGYYIAKISSFYTYVNFTELFDSFLDIFRPSVEIVTSPFYAIKGYVTEMNVYNHPYLIAFGSLTLFFAATYLLARYTNWFSLFNADSFSCGNSSTYFSSDSTAWTNVTSHSINSKADTQKRGRSPVRCKRN